MAEENTKTFHADAGKGSRPRGTGWDKYYSNWDAIFGKKEEAPVEEAITEVKESGVQEGTGIY